MTAIAARDVVPTEIRAAIHAFLIAREAGIKPLSLTKALAAVRRVFPELVISDPDLVDAIFSEAATAGVNLEFSVDKHRRKLGQKALECWENEGGAVLPEPDKSGLAH